MMNDMSRVSVDRSSSTVETLFDFISFSFIIERFRKDPKLSDHISSQTCFAHPLKVLQMPSSSKLLKTIQ